MAVYLHPLFIVWNLSTEAVFIWWRLNFLFGRRERCTINVDRMEENMSTGVGDVKGRLTDVSGVNVQYS